MHPVCPAFWHSDIMSTHRTLIIMCIVTQSKQKSKTLTFSSRTTRHVCFISKFVDLQSSFSDANMGSSLHSFSLCNSPPRHWVTIKQLGGSWYQNAHTTNGKAGGVPCSSWLAALSLCVASKMFVIVFTLISSHLSQSVPKSLLPTHDTQHAMLSDSTLYPF